MLESATAEWVARVFDPLVTRLSPAFCDQLGDHLRHVAVLLRMLDTAATWLLPALLLGAVFAVAATMPTWPRSNPGTPEQRAAIEAGKQHAELMRAQAVAEASVGLECWDPSTGQMGTHLVVEWVDTGAIEVVPFTEATFAQASAGEFWTLRSCTRGDT